MKFQVTFFPEKRKRPDGSYFDPAPIRVRVTYGGKVYETTTGFRIELKNFDTAEGGRVKRYKFALLGNGQVQANEVNQLFGLVRSRLTEYFLKTNQPDPTLIRQIIIDALKRNPTASGAGKFVFDAFLQEWIDAKQLSQSSQTNTRVAMYWLAETARKYGFRYTLQGFNGELLEAFQKELQEAGKSKNTVSAYLVRLRSYWYWLREVKPDLNLPRVFSEEVSIPATKYGTPITLLPEERDKLAEATIPAELEIYRDIFLFQCYTGCRFGDAMKLTPENVTFDPPELRYIQEKKLKVSPATLVIPLHPRALAIIQKYRDAGVYSTLLPPVSLPTVNFNLKKLFRLVGLTRVVPVYNSTTGQVENKPLYEVAGSHMGRRTFIQALKGRVSDDVIASMSGHTAGSKAFTRYYTTTEAMRKEAIEKL